MYRSRMSGRMVGDEGTVEWSDDDAVKSGSNTEGDICDDNPPSRKEDRKKFKTPITTLNMKNDPISTILNKIDAEISTLSRSQSSAGTGSTVIHRPSSRSRSPNRHDEEWTRSQLDRPGPMKATHTFDTSFSSKGRDSPMLNGDLRINGRADIYSDAATHDTEDTQSRKGTSDLDSVSAHDVDEKFKQILRKRTGKNIYMCDLDSVSAHDVDEKFKQILRKRTGYQDSSRAALPSDTDTVKTEDFNRKFQDSLVFSSDDTVEYKSDADESSSDSEKSVKGGEDSLLWDYFDTVPKCASGFKEEEQANEERDKNPQQNTPDHKSFIDRLRPKRSKSSPPIYNKPTNNHQLSPYQSLRKPTYVSDAESVRTEDFEFRFKDLIVNQMDSETDFTDNDPLHVKVKEILQVTLPYRKNERERTQSETDIRLRDRRKEMFNGGHASPRETDNKWRDRQNERINGEVQSSPRETDNRWRDRQKERINGEAQSSPRETDNRWRDRQKEVINGDQPSSREISNKRRHRESTDLRNYHINSGFSSSESSSRSNQLTQSSTFDETDSVTSASYDSKFSRQSSFDGYNHPMSSRSSLGTISLPGLSRSTSQDENFADSCASSWSSLLNSSEEGHEAYAANIQYNPLLEKLFEDAESLNLLPKQNLQILGKQKDQIRNSRRDLILPDEESEEIPFAKYTFNKRPESIESRSPSEKSSSSKDSRDSFDKLSKRNKYLMSMSNDSYMSSSLTSSNFDPENMLSSSGSQPDKKTTKQASSDQWMNSVNEQMIYPAAMPQGYPQQPNFSMPIHSNSIYFPQMPLQQQPPPDQMLMNLGFADDVDNFLPARFAQDWKQKIIKKQQDMYVKAQQQMYYQSRPDITRHNGQLYNQYSEQVSSDSSPEMTVSTSSFSSLSKSDKKSKVISNNAKQNNLIVIEDRGTASERHSSIEKLRVLLKSDSLISSVNKDNTELEIIEKQEAEKKEAMDVKRKQFARARQKSLPIYLETLNEEDECSSVKSRLMNARLQRESRSTDSSQSLSENSSLSHSSSNRDSVSEANFTDNDINEYKLTNLQGTKISQNGDQKLTKEMNNVPSICVEDGVSNESLEIDEILGNCHNKKLDLHVEPAMVSVVLNDTDSKHINAKNLSHLTPHFFGGDVDDKMFRRRSSSSLSVSPMPSSPVTVIEVGLDNQNDSLDNVTDSIDHDDTGHSNHIDSSFSEFSNSLKEKINRNTGTSKEVPTKINNKLTESKHDVVVKNNLPTCQKKFISQVNHVSKTNSLSIEIPSIEHQDICIQADDGSLSPIIRFTDYEYLFQKLMNVDEDNLFYLAKDCGTQYKAQPDNDSLDSDKVHSFFNNSPAASSSRRHSEIIEGCNNTFHKDKEVQTCEMDRQETGIQTDVDHVTSRYLQTSDNCTSTSSYYTRCHCPCNASYSMSDRDNSNVIDIQASLQATIERLEKKTRKYSALYGKKD